MSQSNDVMAISGHYATITYNAQHELFRGEFLGLNGMADFQSTSVEGLVEQGEISLREFLKGCDERNIPYYEEVPNPTHDDSNIMQQYLGVKHINAKPMNRGDYNTLRGWMLPGDENPDDEGFLVEYLNSPTTGMPDGFTNYISWSPKEVFEDSYRPTDGLSFGLAVEAMK